MAKKIFVFFFLIALIAVSFIEARDVRAIPAGVGVIGDSGSQPYQCNGRGGDDTFVWSEVLERLRGIDFGPGVCQDYNNAWAGESIRYHMDKQTSKVLADFNAGKVGKVIIMLGYNDLYSTEEEPDIPALLAEYRENVEEMLAAGIAPENILIIDISQENWQGPKIEQVDRFNAGLKDLSEEKGTGWGSHVDFKAEAACRSTDNQNTYNYGGHTIYNRYGDDWQSFRTKDGHLGTLSNGTLANTTMLGFLGITRMTDTELLTLVNQVPNPDRPEPDCAGAKTTTTITGDSPDPSDRNQAVTVSFTVTSAGGTPTGNVTVTDSLSSATCTGTLAEGQGSCTLTLATGGDRRLTATYAGSNKFGKSSDTENHTVTRASSTTTITGDSPEPSVVGEAVTVSYTVTSSAGTPTGDVTVSDGANSCTGTVAAGSCSVVLSTAGSRTLTASYGGDSNFNTSSDTEAHTVSQASTTTTITGDSPDPSAYNQSVTVNFSVVANAPGGGTPAGNVTVSDGVNSCTGTVAAGSCALALTSIGARTLTASYAGNSNYTSSSSAGANHLVNKADTTTSITGDSPDPSVINQTVTVNYTVTSATGGTPTGNVTVSDGVNSCVGTVAARSCTLTLNTLGVRTLTASYEGDGNFNGSTSAGATHTVNKASTTTTITGDSPDPSVVGQTVTVSYTVTSTNGTPTGNVTVSDGVNSCVGTVATGSCVLTLSTAGSRTLTATYAGDNNFNSSTSAGATHTVNKASTTTTITGDSPDPSIVGLPVTVHYSVTSTGGTPTGNVTVSDGVDACTGTAAAGSCNVTLSTLGARTLTATYQGDSNFYGSASIAVAHTVVNGTQLISIAAQDGWLLESGETTSTGGTLNKGASTFFLGDNAQKKQYRSILSFSTQELPDNAVITKVTLKVRKQAIVGGGNPVNTFQGFLVDVKKGFFGSAIGLQGTDFQAKPNKSYGPFKPGLSSGWYVIDLTPAKGFINQQATSGGVTQVRLRFKLDDNNNTVANYLTLYSGNAPAASAPQLVIEYYVP